MGIKDLVSRSVQVRQAGCAVSAATVLMRDDQTDRVYALAGDTAYTMTELVSEIERQGNKSVEYKDLPEKDYKAALTDTWVREEFSYMMAGPDVGISKGAL